MDEHEVSGERPLFERPMSRRKVLVGGLGAAIGLPSILAACGGSSSSSSSAGAVATGAGAASTSNAPAAHGGTITIARPPAAPNESLDPATSLAAYEYLGALYNRLVKAGAGGKAAPDLALSWTPSTDGKTWTFKLRTDVTWHDGKKFTSKDAAYTLRHILDPKTSSPQAGVLSPFIDIAGLGTPDAATLVVPLKSPNAEFPTLLMHYNCYLIPDGSAATIGKTGIGTGLFKLKSFQPAANGEVVANPDHFDGGPTLDSIKFVSIADVQARVNALLAGQAQLIAQTNLDFATAKVVRANPTTTISPVKNAQWYTMPTLATMKPFTDVRVRQAFKLASDPEAALKLAAQGSGTVANMNPVPPGDADRWPAPASHDPEKAKALLAQAGFPDGLDITLNTSSYDALLTPMSLAYKDSAKAAGIRVSVKEQPADSYYTKVWIKMPFCASYWYIGRPIDQLLNEIFRSGSSYNESLWSSSQFSSLLDAARRELDDAKRKQIYIEAQQLMVAQDATIIPFFADRLTGLSKKVLNYQESGFEFNYKTLALAA